MHLIEILTGFICIKVGLAHDVHSCCVGSGLAFDVLMRFLDDTVFYASNQVLIVIVPDNMYVINFIL